MSVRVLVADDHPMYLYGVQAVLSSDPQIEIVGSATTGRELIRLAMELDPDVVVTDLTMPDLGGVAAAQELLGAQPDLPILVLTMHDDDENVYGALRAGVRGYLLKGADRAELVSTVLALSRGRSVFGPSVAKRIVGTYLENTQRYASGFFPQLTAREREILDLVASGARNAQICNRLGLADKTVRNHLSSLFAKLGVSDRSAAIVLAREAGLGRGSP